MGFKQDIALNAIERWAYGYHLFRETGAIDTSFRLDGLLVPTGPDAYCMGQVGEAFFDRPRLVGVEVKASRSDFLRGLNGGQFEKYDDALAGLYIATFDDVCKASEIPPGVGHLKIFQKQAGHRVEWRCACRRHPALSDTRPSAETAWRLLFKIQESHREKLWEMDLQYRQKLDRIGSEASSKVFAALSAIQKSVEADFAS